MTLLSSLQVIPLESFECMSLTGARVAVVPGGRAVPLTFTNRQEYVARTIHYRLHQMDRQVGAAVVLWWRHSFNLFLSHSFLCIYFLMCILLI